MRAPPNEESACCRTCCPATWEANITGRLLDVADRLGQIDHDPPDWREGDELLRCLRLSAQEAVLYNSLRRGRYQRRSSKLRPLQLLEGEANLDGIAALVVLLREAHEAGNAA